MNTIKFAKKGLERPIRLTQEDHIILSLALEHITDAQLKERIMGLIPTTPLSQERGKAPLRDGFGSKMQALFLNAHSSVR